MLEKSEALEKLYYDYTHLPLGGKRVRCPYWSNKQKILLSGYFKGKGMPKQIVGATLKAAKNEGFNLSEASASAIRKFMEHYRIGVDCSGFVYHMLDAFDKEKGRKGVHDFIQGVNGKGSSRVNAYCLTNNINTVEIGRVNQLEIGDLIRFTKGRHVAIIMRIKRDQKGLPSEIYYAHSGRLSAITGVHLGKILVRKANLGIEKQEWLEKNRKGYGYLEKYFSQQEGDGTRRLKIWLK